MFQASRGESLRWGLLLPQALVCALFQAKSTGACDAAAAASAAAGTKLVTHSVPCPKEQSTLLVLFGICWHFRV